MCRLLETIRVENGEVSNLRFHQQRMDAARWHFFGKRGDIQIGDTIQRLKNSGDSGINSSGLFKLRIVYGEIIHEVELLPYVLPIINSLKLVYSIEIQYAFKLADRSDINKLTSLKEDCDDIMIVKNGQVTDSSYANLAFYDGSSWHTPEKPLLAGTQRAALLENGILLPADIFVEQMWRYEKVRLFNAMIRWQDRVEVDLRNLHP